MKGAVALYKEFDKRIDRPLLKTSEQTATISLGVNLASLPDAGSVASAVVTAALVGTQTASALLGSVALLLHGLSVLSLAGPIGIEIGMYVPHRKKKERF
jgi:hypothetical protein